MASPYHNTMGGVTVTTATATVTADTHLGGLIVVDRAAGSTLTLPAATGSFATYEFVGAVDATGDQVIQVASAADTMMGFAFLGNNSASVSAFYTSDTSDTVTLNGTTRGGYKGWRVVVRDVAASTWQVEVLSEASGTEATPFSAAVS